MSTLAMEVPDLTAEVQRRTRPHLPLPLKALSLLIPPIAAISLFAGTVETTSAIPRARQAADQVHHIAHMIMTVVHDPHLLPDISYDSEPPFASQDEAEIYANVKSAGPIIEEVVAISRSDTLVHDGRPTFGLPNPRLVTTSNNSQYVVGRSGLGPIPGRDLAYVRTEDVILCTVAGSYPRVAAQPGGIGPVIHATAAIVDACPASITIEALNLNTLAASAPR